MSTVRILSAEGWPNDTAGNMFYTSDFDPNRMCKYLYYASSLEEVVSGNLSMPALVIFKYDIELKVKRVL